MLLGSFLRSCPSGLHWLLSLTSLVDVVLALLGCRDGMLPGSLKEWQLEDISYKTQCRGMFPGIYNLSDDQSVWHSQRNTHTHTQALITDT